MIEKMKKVYEYWQDKRYRAMIKLGLYVVGFTIVLLVFAPRAQQNIKRFEEPKEEEKEVIVEENWFDEDVYIYYLDVGLEERILVTVINDFTEKNQEIDDNWLKFNRAFLKMLVDDGVLVSETTDHVYGELIKKYNISFELDEEIYTGEMEMTFDDDLRKVGIKFVEPFFELKELIIEYVD